MYYSVNRPWETKEYSWVCGDQTNSFEKEPFRPGSLKAGRAESPEKAEQINNKNIGQEAKDNRQKNSTKTENIYFSKQWKYGK